MEMTGRVIAILPERSGASSRGEWHTQSFVIETQEQYPKHLCFEVFGADRIAQFAIKGGEIITVSFDIDARQWQDKWFNSIKAWKVDRPGQQQPAQQQNAGAWGGSQVAAAAAQAINSATNFPPPAPTGANAAPAGAQDSPDNLPF